MRLYLTYFAGHEMFMSPEKTLEAVNQEYIHPLSLAKPPKVSTSQIIVTRVDISSTPLYLFAPRDKSEAGRILYIHGGSFFRDIQPAHWSLIQQLVIETGCSVLVPIYPLLPRPIATAYTVAKEMATYINHFECTCVMGDSAGGTITASTMHYHLVQAGATASHVKCVVLIAPLLDLNFSHPSVFENAKKDPWLAVPGLQAVANLWAAGESLNDPIVSPLFGDFDKFPETLVLCGTHDLLVSDARRLKNKYLKLDDTDRESQRHGSVQVGGLTYVEEEEMLHVYPLLPCYEGALGRQRICAFVSNAH